jgi:hypothetical protein
LKPNNFPSIGDLVNLPIQIADLMLQPGESIIVSHRARNSTPVGAPGGWIHLHDTLTVIPTPSGAAILALGALTLVRRRRN